MQPEDVRRRPGLYEAILAAGHQWGDLNGMPWESDESAIAAIAAAYGVDKVVDWVAATSIKPWVEATILQQYSLPKQHSMNQERLDLLLTGEATSERMAELNAAMAWIKAMVNRSNTLEAELRSLDMPALLAITATTGWQQTFPLL